jgi:hypothetical protein
MSSLTTKYTPKCIRLSILVSPTQIAYLVEAMLTLCALSILAVVVGKRISLL